MGKTTDTKKFSSGRLAAAVIAAGLVIAGCSAEEPEPDFTPTLPPSKSSSALDGEDETAPVSEDEEAQPNPAASPDLKPPPIPPELEEKTLEGAEAAARYYVEVFNYGLMAYDGKPLEDHSMPECETCVNHLNSIEIFTNKKQTVNGGIVEIGAEVEMHDTGDRVVVDFIATQAPYEIVNHDGSVEKTGERTQRKMRILTSFEKNKWMIRATANEEIGE